LGAAEGALLREFELLILVLGQQRDEDVDALAVDGADLVLQPVATARAGGGCEMERLSRLYPVRHRSAFVELAALAGVAVDEAEASGQ